MESEVVGRKETCAPVAASAIMPQALLLDLLWREMTSANRAITDALKRYREPQGAHRIAIIRSTLRAQASINAALDLLKEEKLGR